MILIAATIAIVTEIMLTIMMMRNMNYHLMTRNSATA